MEFDSKLVYASTCGLTRKLILEIKAVEEMNRVYKAQVLTYLKLTGLRLGLLINFNVPLIKNGIERIIL
jgi:GxxExxY protein